MNLFSRWNIAAGNFFFRYRNGLFAVIIVVLLAVMRPQVLFESAQAQSLWIGFGAFLAFLGETIRLLTIGYDYIDRGGRGGKVYASRLVRGGVYAHVRNPMYLGNILMAVGLVMYTASFGALLTALPFFLFAYQAIIAAEEAYFTQAFGADYQAYLKEVPSLLPRWKGLTARLGGERYDWQKALRKDYGNVFFLVTSLIIIGWWRVYFLKGAGSALEAAPIAMGLILLASVPYFTVMGLKKAGRLG